MTKEKEPKNIPDCVSLYKRCLLINLIELIEGTASIEDVKRKLYS
jgi:hypothetical protein